jgi:BirA family biotin operon repressor/biotin-[acetyl-CoA-carboxylase] ligase
MSIVLRLPFGMDRLPLVTLALGLAVSESLAKVTGIGCDLRWPNDILIGGKKCAGILTVLEAPAVIAGIGINVNHAALPEDIAAIATSLRMAGGRCYSREEIISEILPAVDAYCSILATEGAEPVLRMFTQASTYALGRRVEVDQGDSVLRGVTAGLTAAGFLIIRDEKGKHHQIIAGGVRPCS